MKIVPAALILIGVALLIRAPRLVAPFEDGSFLLQIVTALTGTLCIGVGIAWLQMLRFLAA